MTAEPANTSSAWRGRCAGLPIRTSSRWSCFRAGASWFRQDAQGKR